MTLDKKKKAFCMCDEANIYMYVGVCEIQN